MMWRAPVHYVVDDAASTSTLYGGCCGEHRYTMWWITRRAPVQYVVNDAASNNYSSPPRRVCGRDRRAAPPGCSGASSISKQRLKAVPHIVVSSADTTGAINTGFETVNLHRPTRCWAAAAAASRSSCTRCSRSPGAYTRPLLISTLALFMG